VILDCSAVEIVDVDDFERIRKVVAAAALMGVRTVLAGLRPGVVSALVDLGVDLDGIDAAVDIDDAFRKV
jgi:rsbT antagonist protein RsbS